jgi:hypothetical protein
MRLTRGRRRRPRPLHHRRDLGGEPGQVPGALAERRPCRLGGRLPPPPPGNCRSGSVSHRSAALMPGPSRADSFQRGCIASRRPRAAARWEPHHVSRPRTRRHPLLPKKWVLPNNCRSPDHAHDSSPAFRRRFRPFHCPNAHDLASHRAAAPGRAAARDLAPSPPSRAIFDHPRKTWTRCGPPRGLGVGGQNLPNSAPNLVF